MENKLEIEELVADHPLVASHRLPVVRSWYPRYSYFVALVVPDPEDTYNLWDLEAPTDEEALIAALYLQYTIERQGFYEHYLKQLHEKAVVDVDGGCNTTILGKNKTLGWQYQKPSWRHGPWPYDRVLRFDKLIDLIDHIENYSPDRWNAFKAKNPEVFS